MEKNKEITAIDGAGMDKLISNLSASIEKNVKAEYEDKLKSEVSVAKEEISKSFESKLENIEKSYKADAEELKTAMLSIKKSSRGSDFSVAHPGEGDVVDVTDIMKSVVKQTIKGETYDMNQYAQEVGSAYSKEIIKKSNVYMQYNGTDGVYHGEEAIAKTVRTTDGTSMYGTPVPTLLRTFEELEMQNSLVADMPTYIINGTTSAYIVRQNEYGKSVKLSEGEDVPTGFDSGISFKKEEAKMVKLYTEGSLSFEASTVDALGSNVERLLANTFPRTIARDFGIDLMKRTQNMNQPGFIPYIQNVGTEDAWSYDVNYIKTQRQLSDNSLVFDKDGRVGYIRTAAANTITLDDINDLIASVVDGNDTGYVMVMSRATRNYCAKMKFLDGTYLQDRNAILDKSPLLDSIAGVPIKICPFMEPIASNKIPMMLVRLDSYLAILKSGQDWVMVDPTQNPVVKKKWLYTTFMGTKLLSGNFARCLYVQ